MDKLYNEIKENFKDNYECVIKEKDNQKSLKFNIILEELFVNLFIVCLTFMGTFDFASSSLSYSMYYSKYLVKNSLKKYTDFIIIFTSLTSFILYSFKSLKVNFKNTVPFI